MRTPMKKTTRPSVRINQAVATVRCMTLCMTRCMTRRIALTGALPLKTFSRLLPAFMALAVTTLAITALSFASETQASEETWTTINLKNADIREFVTQISTITGKSFIVDPRVKGNVTIISNTPMGKDAIYQLFLSVLRVQGYAAIPSGNVTKIVQQVLAKQSSNPNDFQAVSSSEELVTSVIPVRNSRVADLVKILRPLVPQYGHLAGIDQPNALIISDHADNVVRLTEIISRVDVAANETITIVDLQHAWVEDMIALLLELAPDQIGSNAQGPNRVTVVASERTNSLVIKGEKQTVDRVEALISRLDVPANRSGTTQVIPLAHADATDLAELLEKVVKQSEEGEQTSNITTNIQADKALNALVLRATPARMLELKEIIDDLDIRRRQVLIEAAIVEVTADFTKQLGTELFVGDASRGNLPLGLTAPAGTLAQVLQNMALGTANAATAGAIELGGAPLLAGGRLSRTGTSFGLIVRALSSNNNVNLLSTPSITTMQNEKAKIVVGQQVPFRTGSTLTGTEGAANPFTTIQREAVGLTLEVTPRINEGNLIRLEIHQEASELDMTSFSEIGISGSADLITNLRTIDTTVLVDNEEVIVIGGLIRDRESVRHSRVPVLGRIPGLGFLFRSKTTMIQKQTLLVFLRPTVITSKKEIRQATLKKFKTVYEVEIHGRDPAKLISELFDGHKP